MLGAMTADTRRAALVERMIQVLIAGPNKPHYSRDEAEAKTRATGSAALDIALEEAALLAEGMDWQSHGALAVSPHGAAEQAGDEIAAAIRALKGKP